MAVRYLRSIDRLIFGHQSRGDNSRLDDPLGEAQRACDQGTENADRSAHKGTSLLERTDDNPDLPLARMQPSDHLFVSFSRLLRPLAAYLARERSSLVSRTARLLRRTTAVSAVRSFRGRDEALIGAAHFSTVREIDFDEIWWGIPTPPYRDGPLCALFARKESLNQSVRKRGCM